MVSRGGKESAQGAVRVRPGTFSMCGQSTVVFGNFKLKSDFLACPESVVYTGGHCLFYVFLSLAVALEIPESICQTC